jgi:hypothetical protein
MKVLITIVSILGILAMAAVALSQDIGMTFDELGTKPCIDGQTELIPNPAFGNLPSAYVYVGAWDLPEIFGYEYHITASSSAALDGGTTFYPDTSANFGTDGDVRVGTGVCFHAGDAQAGPDPTHIRLAEHIYTFLSTPAVDQIYCIGPVLATGDPYPHYTECVDTPVPLPFGLHSSLAPLQALIPYGCIIVIFDSEPPQSCSEVVAIEDLSWGGLKAAY